METEVWKDIPGYEESLQGSSLGRIRCKEKGRRRKVGNDNVIRARVRDKTGHLSFTISRHKEEQVHRLIAAAFLGPCPEGMMVLHNNGNPADNRPVNLRYGTCAEELAWNFGVDSSMINRIRNRKRYGWFET